MAKVQIENDYVDIRVSLLERMTLAERSRRVPLLHIQGVDTFPPNEVSSGLARSLDQPHRWSEGVLYDEEVSVPFGGRDSRDSSRLLTIDLCDEDVNRVLVELDDDAPEVVADRIRLAVAAAQAEAIGQMRARSSSREIPPMPRSDPPPAFAPLHATASGGEEGIPYRITPLPRIYSEPAPPMRLDDDRSLARLGAWLLSLGMFGVLTGSVIVAGGAIPGLLAIGAGAACLLMGGLALAVVLHHQ